MALQKFSFVEGIFGTEFMQWKTTDDVFLKDLLEGTIFPALEIYNRDADALAGLVAYRHEEAVANAKRLYSDNAFTEISEFEVPPSKAGFESWNTPQPLSRLGAANKMTSEVIKQMSSKGIIEYVNTVFLADAKQLVRRFLQNMITKEPAARVDCLTNLAANPVAFWNDETTMDTPRPNGQITFDSNHDHYITVDVANVTDADDMTELLGLVTEHEGMGDAQLIIWVRSNSLPLTQIKALDLYRPIETVSPIIGVANSPRYDQSGLAQALLKGSFTLSRSVDVVGTYDSAIVVATPDLPEKYILCTAYFGDNNRDNPIGWREHPQFLGLIMASPTGENPIIGHNAQFRRYLSGYVNNRSSGAVMYTGHGTTWAEPTFV